MNNKLLPNTKILNEKNIEDCIYNIRGQQVMLDSDIAEFFGVETRRLNEQMRRNISRFPEDFCFTLTSEETEDILRSHFATANSISSKRRYNPYVYTEHGIIALAGVLKSETADKMSVEIARKFIQMRKFILENGEILLALAKLQNRQLEFENETNHKFDQILKYIDKLDLPKASLFYEGQWFDAFEYISSLIAKANQSILLIDPYCDGKALSFFKQRKKEVSVLICGGTESKLRKEEIDVFEKEYGPIKYKTLNNVHDRFLIIDNEECYSLGTSLNYAGKKLFMITKIVEKSVIKNIIKICEEA